MVQPVHKTPKMAVGEKTKRAWNLDGIVEAPGRNIGLPNNGDTCHGSAYESTFHGSERYGLMIADHLGLLVPSRKSD